ncbi:signal peptidase I [Thermocoleostomius sinensis A174]|uniref:Signal peptidase I n=2 Tax=Thermocoleostomius TaxID=3065395 RepID=A0A9E9CC46_9CYAN|nr:signal peptidase I [Thermocoleostomius sinensis A174]
MPINPNQKPSSPKPDDSRSARPANPMSQPNSADRPPAVAQHNQPPKHTENPWTEALKTIGLSLVLALGIRHFVAEARYIPSESMVPTLEVNDRLIVEKISYLFNPPQRYDIIVFIPPEAAGQACLGLASPGGRIKDAFIKRVIGLPGEEIAVRNGQVFVNGQPLQENYISAPPNYQWGPQVIDDNSYLVLGDNRNNSCDGHFWGPVPRENIIGRAVFRFWPPGRVGGISPQTP